MYRWLAGNLRLWSAQELVSRIHILRFESMHAEAVTVKCKLTANHLICILLYINLVAAAYYYITCKKCGKVKYLK